MVLFYWNERDAPTVVTSPEERPADTLAALFAASPVFLRCGRRCGDDDAAAP